MHNNGITHDLGGVQIYATAHMLTMVIPFADEVSRNAVKRLRATFDKKNKLWRVPLRGRSVDDAVSEFTKAILSEQPAPWVNALPALAAMRSTTTRHTIVIGPAGVHLRLPNGHPHEYTLKAHAGATQVAFTQPDFCIPAAFCNDQTIKKVILDIVEADRALYERSIEYLDGFCIRGSLQFQPADPLLMAVTVGSTLYASPNVPPHVDKKLPCEPVHVIPLHVAAAKGGDLTDIEVKLDFFDKDESYRLARKFESVRRPTIEGTHLKGSWRRSRK